MTESDAEGRKEVFAWFGGAAYQAQCFEVELHTLLLFVHQLKSSTMTTDGLKQIDTKLSKKNLGFLIQELKRNGEMHPDFEMLLNEYREKRNYLMHTFFFENSLKLLSKEGCEVMVEELQGIANSLREADEIATLMSKNVRELLGLDEQSVEEYVRKTILNETGYDIDKTT